MQHETRSPLAARFDRFARECALLGSPFYERLSTIVANNAELLDRAAHAPREPIPNVYFGAVHYLLLKGSTHELREYFPSTAEQPRQDAELSDTFSDFCARFSEKLTAIVKTRLVQTNEVNRSAILVPAISLVYELGTRRPLALIEVGTSAGLNLLWDRYRIGYSDGTVLGDRESAVRIACENRGSPLSAGTGPQPNVADRIGIDLNPIELRDSDERLWLRALVWPDHRQRAARLEAAIALALRCECKFVRGDALSVLPNVLANVPPQWTPCVYHSSVLYQFTSEERERFTTLLADASKEQPIWQVSAENEEGLRLFAYRAGGIADEQFLGAFDAHGRWLCWRR